jgi:hypothetical protein
VGILQPRELALVLCTCVLLQHKQTQTAKPRQGTSISPCQHSRLKVQQPARYAKATEAYRYGNLDLSAAMEPYLLDHVWLKQGLLQHRRRVVHQVLHMTDHSQPRKQAALSGAIDH